MQMVKLIHAQSASFPRSNDGSPAVRYFTPSWIPSEDLDSSGASTAVLILLFDTAAGTTSSFSSSAASFPVSIAGGGGPRARVKLYDLVHTVSYSESVSCQKGTVKTHG